MAKIYTKTYSVNYASIAKASPALVVPAEKKTCFKIPFPSEGFLERLIVYQVRAGSGPQDETPVDFEVELLNSKLPYPPGDYEVTDDPADALEAYRVQTPPTAALSQTAGNVLTLADDDYGIGFRNVDGGWTMNERSLYLLITPDSATEDTMWNVVLQCRTDVG